MGHKKLQAGNQEGAQAEFNRAKEQFSRIACHICHNKPCKNPDICGAIIDERDF